MNDFDYYINNPNRAFKFTPEGFQLTPMAKTAIELAATNRSKYAIGGSVKQEESKKALIRAMELRLKQEAAFYLEK